MKTFRLKNYLLAAFTSSGILITTVFLILKGLKPEIKIQIFLAIIFTMSVISAGLWIHEFKKLKTARLIMENPILRLCIAIISNISDRVAKSEDTDIVISYFGILIDTKIIKFNQNGIRLKDVEIGRDFISLSYGTDKKMQKIWLARPLINLVKLNEIVEKFRHETGIDPRILY